MKPLKLRDITPVAAGVTGLPEEVVHTVAEFYWTEVRAALTQLSHVRVHLSGLGDFSIKAKVLHSEIERHDRMKNYLAQSTRYQALSTVGEKLDRLLSARELVLRERQRKDFIRTHKKLVHENDLATTSSDLAVPGAYPAGTVQQVFPHHLGGGDGAAPAEYLP